MSLAAVDDVTDAFTATRTFLWPIDAGRWLRLAVIAFFVGTAGGSGGGGGGGGGGGSGSGPITGPVEFPELVVSDAAVAAALGLVALVALLGVAYAAIGAIMEFVLVESLRHETVRLRRFWARHWRAGLRLFGFRVIVGLLGAAAVGLVLGAAFLAAGGPAALETPLRFVPFAIVAIPLTVVIGVATALALGFTTSFVVPVMLLEGVGVLEGWRRFWPTFRSEWREYATFVLIAFVLRLVVGVVVGVVFAVLAVAVLAPFGAVGIAVYLAGGGQLGLAVLAALAGLGAIGLLVLLALGALLGVPVVTYFRYYALLVLGDTEPAFDVVPDRRAAIRASDA